MSPSGSAMPNRPLPITLRDSDSNTSPTEDLKPEKEKLLAMSSEITREQLLSSALFTTKTAVKK